MSDQLPWLQLFKRVHHLIKAVACSRRDSIIHANVAIMDVILVSFLLQALLPMLRIMDNRWSPNKKVRPYGAEQIPSTLCIQLLEPRLLVLQCTILAH